MGRGLFSLHAELEKPLAQARIVPPTPTHSHPLPPTPTHPPCRQHARGVRFRGIWGCLGVNTYLYREEGDI